MGIKWFDSHLFLPWSSIGPVDLAVGHSVPSEPIPVNEEWYWEDDGNNKSMNTTLEGRAWMGRICNPNPCDKNCVPFLSQTLYLSSFIFLVKHLPSTRPRKRCQLCLGPKLYGFL